MQTKERNPLKALAKGKRTTQEEAKEPKGEEKAGAEENKKAGFMEFVEAWFAHQNLSLPEHQRRMAAWLSELYEDEIGAALGPNAALGARQGLLMAFRNSGKSTMVGLFCGWILYADSSRRILVVAADYALAKKMARNVKRIIERHPMAQGMKPGKADQWASDQFTVVRDAELRDPSMLAKGLESNLTGARAEIVICDDVEVPGNCGTKAKRDEMREKLSELDYVLTPDGMQLYIGTPHSFDTIYRTEAARLQDGGEEGMGAPFLLGFRKLEIPILDADGRSAWPERFSEARIASIRSRTGEAKFLSQMMLRPVDIRECRLDPSRLVPYRDELEMLQGNGSELLKLGGRKLTSASCWWDPSLGSQKGDDSVVACVFSDEDGRLYLHDVEYIRVNPGTDGDNLASAQCEKVAAFVERNYLGAITVEANGIGKFLPGILRQTFKSRRLAVAVREASSKARKEIRILEAFDVLLAERALNVHRRVFKTRFVDQMREWSPDGGGGRDDALDAVAGCLLAEPVRIKPNIEFDANAVRRNWRGGAKQYAAATRFEV